MNFCNEIADSYCLPSLLQTSRQWEVEKTAANTSGHVTDQGPRLTPAMMIPGSFIFISLYHLLQMLIRWVMICSLYVQEGW